MQGLFNLDTGRRLGGIARKMQAQANQLWAENGCPQTLPPAPEDSGGIQDVEVAAQSEFSGPARYTIRVHAGVSRPVCVWGGGGSRLMTGTSWRYRNKLDVGLHDCELKTLWRLRNTLYLSAVYLNL